MTGRGLVVAPWLDVAEAREGRVTFEMRRPDGTRTTASGRIEVPFIHPTPRVPHACVILVDVAKDEVPVGTELWLVGAS